VRQPRRRFIRLTETGVEVEEVIGDGDPPAGFYPETLTSSTHLTNCLLRESERRIFSPLPLGMRRQDVSRRRTIAEFEQAVR
jgi:hypothetical protein